MVAFNIKKVDLFFSSDPKMSATAACAMGWLALPMPVMMRPKKINVRLLKMILKYCNKNPIETSTIDIKIVFLRPYLSDALPIHGAAMSAANVEMGIAMPIKISRQIGERDVGNKPYFV